MCIILDRLQGICENPGAWGVQEQGPCEALLGALRASLSIWFTKFSIFVNHSFSSLYMYSSKFEFIFKNISLPRHRPASSYQDILKAGTCYFVRICINCQLLRTMCKVIWVLKHQSEGRNRIINAPHDKFDYQWKRISLSLRMYLRPIRATIQMA